MCAARFAECCGCRVSLYVQLATDPVELPDVLDLAPYTTAGAVPARYAAELKTAAAAASTSVAAAVAADAARAASATDLRYLLRAVICRVRTTGRGSHHSYVFIRERRCARCRLGLLLWRCPACALQRGRWGSGHRGLVAL